MLTIDAAIRHLRDQPEHADLIRDAYLGEDTRECAERFAGSAEFLEVMTLLQGRLAGSTIVDLGAGSGIASYAFAMNGAKRVYALEPDASEEVGRGALGRITGGLPIETLSAVAENIPIEDEGVDIVYGRQVLHHTTNLSQVMHECSRILRKGGLFLACREHVIRNEKELAEFLDGHPVHKLAGNENAYYLDQYLSAIRGAGLRLKEVFGLWDSVINAFPAVRSQSDLRGVAREFLGGKYGRVGYWAARSKYVRRLAIGALNASSPAGRQYSFLAEKVDA